jgi:thiamine pyrophosphate-dependent acetolactate synthase large subunit-like protein
MIAKNNTVGDIKWEQLVLEGNPEYGVDLQPIDFEIYERACRIPGNTIDDPMRADEAGRRPLPSLAQRLSRRSWIPMSRSYPARLLLSKRFTSPRGY